MRRIFEANHVSCGYAGKDIIKDMCFKLDRGEKLCIIGPNGCGKTTLLKALANLIPYRGSVKFESKEISEMKRKSLAKRIALMTQITEVYFPYTVLETVSLGRYAYSNGLFSKPTREDLDIVTNCLEKVNIIDLKDKLISELSGGQLQRVYLARIFAQDPEIILLDEPTNYLDLKCQVELLEYLIEWSDKKGKTIIGVLHDLNLVHMLADKVLLIKEGKVFSHGDTKTVLSANVLESAYGLDIKGWMMSVLRKWEQ